MRTLIAFIVGLLLASRSAAIVDTLVDWQAVEVQAVVEGEPVTVSARVEQGQVAGLALTVRGERVEVPKPELAGVPKVLLRTLRVVSPDVRSHEGITVRVEVELEPLARSSEQNGVARFHFIGSSYRGRLVERVVSGKVVVHELKEPGQVARPAR